MSSTLSRAFSILELLSGKPDGLRLGEIASQLDLPKSAVHRTLAALSDLGHVKQESETGQYALTLRMVSRALRHVSNLPLVSAAGPILDELALSSGELVRLSIADGDTLAWVAMRQGARYGLRYDPVAGLEVKLVRTSSGLAWLSGIERERAIALIDEQGFDDLGNYGPSGASNREEALVALDEVTKMGFSYTDSTFELGTATVAVPIREPGKEAVGALSIAGPNVRLPYSRALEIKSQLVAAAKDIAVLSLATSGLSASE